MDIILLRPEDHAAWLPLWRGYQAFYAVAIPDDVSAVTWARLLDPAEPMAGALAWDGGRAIGLVHHAAIVPPGPSATTSTFRTSSSTQPSAARASAARSSRMSARARDAGCSHVHWLTHETNTRARKLYDHVAQRSGFVQYRKLIE